MAEERKNMKARLENGEALLGTWCGIPSPSLAEAIGLSGIDFAIIDAEHGPVSMETAQGMVRAFDVTGTPSLIRVSANEPHLILRALDTGASGIQVPHVSTAADAARVVGSAKYYPAGARGFTPFTRAGGYGTKAAGHTERSNDETIVVVNVEGKKGVNNLDDISAVSGIDVVFVGPYDLSQSLGAPGKVDAPEIISAIKKCVKIAERKGLACGSYAGSSKYLDILVECGVRYITYMVDSAMIERAYRGVMGSFSGKNGGCHE
ncbi:MAG: aldolase/citrate lyase family protein [Candidatus Omnitrophota bacterium]